MQTIHENSESFGKILGYVLSYLLASIILYSVFMITKKTVSYHFIAGIVIAISLAGLGIKKALS